MSSAALFFCFCVLTPGGGAKVLFALRKEGAGRGSWVVEGGAVDFGCSKKLAFLSILGRRRLRLFLSFHWACSGKRKEGGECWAKKTIV